jgi:hypothetical protein
MTRSSRAAGLLAVLLAAAPPTRAAAASPTPAALERAEFDQPITLAMSDAAMADVFREVALRTGVPFVLYVPADASRTLTFNAKNLSARGLLISLADTYGLAYSPDGNDVVVRRSGSAEGGTALRIGPNDPVPIVELRLQVLGPKGEILSSPKVITRLNRVAEVQQGLEDYSLEVKVTPLKVSDGSLELRVATHASQLVSPTRVISDHLVEVKTVVPGPTILFKGEKGHQVVLTDWALRGPTPGAANAPQAARQVELSATIRNVERRVLSTPRITTQMGQAAEIKQGFKGWMMILDNNRPVRRPLCLLVKIVPQRETPEGLELLVDVTAPRAVSDTHDVADHQLLTKVAGPGQTSLFKTDDGTELLLSWTVVDRGADHSTAP